LSTRTVGRILKANREAEGLSKPRRSSHQKKEMPFEASFRHEIWTSDVRYIDHSIPETGQAYVVSVLDNYSRAILASAVTLAQDTNAYLSVLHAAIERHGSPNKIVTDGGGIFKSNRAKAVYRSLHIGKEEIERRQPWQSYIEATFNIQRRMADFHFERAENWEALGPRGHSQGPRTRRVRRPVPEQARDAAGGAVFLPGSPVARVASVRSPLPGFASAEGGTSSSKTR
jgi:putative transposase